MPITEIQRGSSRALGIEGAFTLPYIADIRDALLHTMHKADDIVIDMQGVTELDVSGLQVLCAAHKSAVRLGKRLALAGAPPGALIDVAGRAGYVRQFSCIGATDGRCLWTEAAHG